MKIVAIFSFGLAVVASCHPPAPAPNAPKPVRTADALTLAHLLGDWEWSHESDGDGAHRTELEHWHLAVDPSAPADTLRAIGGYDRDVEFRSTDGVPFTCNEQPIYHQRARFTVRADVTADGVTITETGYQAEPSPCDHGFRKIGAYKVLVAHDEVLLQWDHGEETLRRAPDRAPPEWPGAHPSWNGAWAWSAHTMDDDGNLRDEREDWQITVGEDGLASATYVRTVSTVSKDDHPITCAGTRRWSYVDRYVLEGHVTNDLLTLTETASDPGTHPCLTTTPTRLLDSLTAERDGAFLELEWRGKRRQVLHRER
ncbi:MAG TPA: hypothetical protein VL463_14745 [Kofleriaceae bacterium]|nr:hypothetical protein [Kofleriaceae bacterium]